MGSKFGLALAYFAGVLGVPAATADATVGESGRIARSRFTDKQFNAIQIVTARPDGSDVREITKPAAGVQDVDPKWSPNGRRIERQDLNLRPLGPQPEGLDALAAIGPCGAALSHSGSAWVALIWPPGLDPVPWQTLAATPIVRRSL